MFSKDVISRKSTAITLKVLVDNNIKKPLVSIIIPTYNSESTIEMCLISIKKQTYYNIEILVIDNSSDQTVFKAKKFRAKVFVYNGKMTNARNYGAKNAVGKYLFHIDSDMELMPDVIKECVSKCENDDIDALIIPERSVGDGYWAQCKALEKQMLISELGYESARFMCRYAYESIGGYDEVLEAGEDYDIHHRLHKGGFVISRINSFINHYEGKLTLNKIASKYRKYGKTIYSYSFKHKNLIKKQASTPHIYIKNYILLFRNISLLPGLIIMHVISFTLMGRHSRRVIKSTKSDVK